MVENSGVNIAFAEAVKGISDRILTAQGPLRILDSIKWDDDIQKAFFASGCKELPKLDANYYNSRAPLAFDAAEKRREFHEIDRDVTRKLGQMHPLSAMLRRICHEYQMVVRMIEARGTPEFALLSQQLYGSASDVFHAGDPTVADLGVMVEDTLMNLLEHESMCAQEKTITAEQAVEYLNDKMQQSFPGCGIRVLISDGIVADAAAGNDYIKIRADAMFNQEDLDVLEVHEGWIHLGTTLNGLAQPYCSFLGKGPPSATITQEGLAVLTEILTLRSTPTRLHKLVNRVRAVTLAEEGANFVEVFNYMIEKGQSQEAAYRLTSRIFRGSVADGKPFTKDITYLKGFILTYNFFRLAISQGKVERLPLLFVGKVMLEDLGVIASLHEEGIVTPPQFIPPFIKEMKGLATWFSFSKFIGQLNFAQLEADYSNLL